MINELRTQVDRADLSSSAAVYLVPPLTKVTVLTFRFFAAAN